MEAWPHHHFPVGRNLPTHETRDVLAAGLVRYVWDPFVWQTLDLWDSFLGLAVNMVSLVAWSAIRARLHLASAALIFGSWWFVIFTSFFFCRVGLMVPSFVVGPSTMVSHNFPIRAPAQS